MSKFTHIVGSDNEAALVEQLHDLLMKKKGPNAIIARAMKDLMPALMRFVTDELERGTPAEQLVLATGHIALSVHMSALLTITGGAQNLAPMLPTVIEHVHERYATAAEHIGQLAAEVAA